MIKSLFWKLWNEAKKEEIMYFNAPNLGKWPVDNELLLRLRADITNNTFEREYMCQPFEIEKE